MKMLQLGLLRLRGLLSENYCYIKQRRCLYTQNFYLNTRNVYMEHSNLQKRNTNGREVFNNFASENTHSVLIDFRRNFSRPNVFSDPDKFGSLSYSEAEKVEMDKDEEAEEEYGQNEVSVPKWQKFSPGQYAKKIKSYIKQGDLNEALNVLDLMKRNRDQPNVHVYNLLIYGFAEQGDLKTCFKLYNNMKKRGLKPNAPTYTSLFNACAISKNKNEALKQLHSLRQRLEEELFPLNDTHYNVMIKAFAYHGEVLKAFELADVMTDKHLKFTDVTYSCLFHAAISDKENGLRHALVIWHLMKKFCVKPNIQHYNQMLRAIKETKFGDLKINDFLIPNTQWTQIVLSNHEKPDLLASPPVLSTLLATLIEQPANKLDNTRIVNNTSKAALQSTENNVLTTQSAAAEIISQNLNQILEKNRLIMFGGLENILERIEEDGITPSVAILTMLLEIIPKTTQSEEFLMEYARKKKINLDVTFYNMLIRKRSLRFDYEAAKAVLNLMQLSRLVPNIQTYAVLALGCVKRKDAQEIIKEMENVGYVPNIIIIGTLVHNATHRRNFPYIIDMLKYMKFCRIKPNDKILEYVNTMSKKILLDIRNKDKRNRQAMKRLAEDHKMFMEYYEEWKKKWV